MSWLQGKDLAAELRGDVRERAADLSGGVRLAIVLATADEGALWYSRSIERAAEKEGVRCDRIELPAQATQDELEATLTQLGEDPEVHGVILQTPLPPQVDAEALAELIPPAKDLDGMNSASAGRLLRGTPAFAPATAEAVLRLLERAQIDPAGKRAVVVGRSHVVGRPVSEMLLARDATVTVCHSKTPALPAVTREAEILVVAVGRANYIDAEFVGEGAVVIDVGTNAADDGSLVGDVDPGVVEKAALLTPVPGGVGPVTTALLLTHAVEAAETLARSSG